MQQVEREGIAAEQIIVDHERPHEVVAAQYVERGRHLAAFEIAAFVHALFEVGDLFFVDERLELAWLGKIGERRHECAAQDALVFLRRHVREHRREQRSAEAVAQRVHFLLAGGRLDRRQRCQRTFDHVVVESLLRVPRVRIHPGNHEHREALVEAPFHQRVLFPQVEDVVLVDPRRNDEQRPLMHLLRGGLVLDELHQIGLPDHLAGCGRDVDPQLESVRIGHGNTQLSAAPLDVLQQIVQAFDQVLAAGRDGLAKHFRIGEREIGRRHGVDVLPGEEIDFLRRFVVQAFHAGYRVVEPARRDQVGLLDIVEQEMLLPVFMLEPLVAFRRLDDRRRRMAPHARERSLPQRHVIPPQIHLRFGELIGVRHHFGRQVHEGLGDPEFIGGERASGRALLRDEIAEELGAAVSGVGKGMGKRLGIGRGGIHAEKLREKSHRMR